MSGSGVEDLIRDVVEESERTKGEPYPEGTRAVRRQRGVVLSVRLSAQEHADLLKAADEAQLPASTLVRSLVQDHLARLSGLRRAPRSVKFVPAGEGTARLTSRVRVRWAELATARRRESV